MLAFVICLLVIGLIVGAVAPLFVPGRQNMPITDTIVLGLLGSLVGGLLGDLLFGQDGAEALVQPAGIIGSAFGAVVVLVLFVKFGRRSVTGAYRSLPNYACP